MLATNIPAVIPATNATVRVLGSVICFFTSPDSCKSLWLLRPSRESKRLLHMSHVNSCIEEIVVMFYGWLLCFYRLGKMIFGSGVMQSPVLAECQNPAVGWDR